VVLVFSGLFGVFLRANFWDFGGVLGFGVGFLGFVCVGSGCREAASGVSLREYFWDGYVDWWFIASSQAVGGGVLGDWLSLCVGW